MTNPTDGRKTSAAQVTKPTRAEEIIQTVRAMVAAESKHARISETDPENTSRDEADLLLGHLTGSFTLADCDAALRLVRRRSPALPPVEQAPQPVVLPFVYGIMCPDGTAYLDEICVDSNDSQTLADVIEEQELEGHKVVALYTHPAPPEAPPVEQAPQPVAQEPAIYVSRKSLDELLSAEGSHVALQTLIHRKPLRSGNGVPLYATPTEAAPGEQAPAPETHLRGPADQIISQIEELFPNWRSYRDLVDCIECTLHNLRKDADHEA